MMPLPGGITSTFSNATLGPVDEVEAILVAAILDRAVPGERIGHIAAALHRQRVIDDQLHRHYRIDLGRVAAHVRNRIAQARQVDQRGLAEDVVADHARGNHGKSRSRRRSTSCCSEAVQRGWIAAPHQVLGEHARGVGQRGVGAEARAHPPQRARRNNPARCRGGFAGVECSWSAALCVAKKCNAPLAPGKRVNPITRARPAARTPGLRDRCSSPKGG